jgi:hypothetical protein
VVAASRTRLTWQWWLGILLAGAVLGVVLFLALRATGLLDRQTSRQFDPRREPSRLVEVSVTRSAA